MSAVHPILDRSLSIRIGLWQSRSKDGRNREIERIDWTATERTAKAGSGGGKRRTDGVRLCECFGCVHTLYTFVALVNIYWERKKTSTSTATTTTTRRTIHGHFSCELRAYLCQVHCVTYYMYNECWKLRFFFCAFSTHYAAPYNAFLYAHRFCQCLRVYSNYETVI